LELIVFSPALLKILLSLELCIVAEPFSLIQVLASNKFLSEFGGRGCFYFENDHVFLNCLVIIAFIFWCVSCSAMFCRQIV